MFSDIHCAHTRAISVVFTESAPKAAYYNNIVNDFQTLSVMIYRLFFFFKVNELQASNCIV